jgi:hypothetical protein
MISKMKQMPEEAAKKVDLGLEIFEHLRRMATDPDYNKKVKDFSVEYIYDMQKSELPRKVGVYSPSSIQIGGIKPQTCLRKLAYGRVNRESTFYSADARLQNIFAVGHDAGNKYQAWFKFLYRGDFTAEVSAYHQDLGIYGHCDGVIRKEIDGRVYSIGLELKTASRSSIAGMGRSPQQKHQDQGTIYSVCLGLDMMVYFYECKDNQEILTFNHTKKDMEERWSRIETRLKNVNRCIQKGQLPARREKQDYVCADCKFEKECWKSVRPKSGLSTLLTFSRRNKNGSK